MARRDLHEDETRRVRTITRRLCRVYPDRRPLLDYVTPYQLAIAVILSAQTTDVQVNSATPKLFGRYPTPQALADAKPADVEQIVHSTGFFRTKARNIIGAARAISDRFHGEVPQSMEDLTSIPGMGRKSANVVRGVIYGLPSIVVDTHLTRVCNRLQLVSGHNPDVIERLLRGIVPESLQTDFSMVVNLHGRYRCTARSPDCKGCEIGDLCRFRVANTLQIS